MKERRMERLFCAASQVLAVIGSGITSAWLFRFLTDSDYTNVIRDMFIALIVSGIAMAADSISEWYSKQAEHKACIARQQEQKWALYVEDRRMKTNIDIV